MSNIKYGSTQYFELLTFQDKLKSRHLDKLGLTNLDRLKFEIDMKIKSIILRKKREAIKNLPVNE